jgi:hypothetical protein
VDGNVPLRRPTGSNYGFGNSILGRARLQSPIAPAIQSMVARSWYCGLPHRS